MGLLFDYWRFLFVCRLIWMRRRFIWLGWVGCGGKESAAGRVFKAFCIVYGMNTVVVFRDCVIQNGRQRKNLEY